MVPQQDKDHKSERVTRERVIDAAAALFAERGYGSTTTREIAERLDIQRASLYYHVSSKDQILFDVCELAMNQGLAEVRSAMDELAAADAMQRLRRLIETHLASSLNNRNRHLTMLLELRSLPPEPRARLMALRDGYEAEIDAAIAAAQNEGYLRSDLKVTDLRLILLNMLNWTLIWYADDGSYTPHGLAELMSTIFIEGAMAR